MKRKKNRIRKKEFKRITKKHEQKLLLRQQAIKEVDILINLLSEEISCEEKLLKEAIFHLEAKQKELTYFGYRGIFVGVVVVILTNFFTTQGLPTMYKILNEINNINSIFEKTVYYIVAVVVIIILALLFGFALWQSLVPFFGNDKEIREQIYMNEYMIKILQNKMEEMIQQ
ncbi:hypothetical protein [Sporosarcina sp. Te-1]|uniref:hypothetical protein n=1 Tax=Sporosarcina sp. Te-1 TaxID=2818390 RepID=UPI001A9DD8FD|nr:hypothetical protein [Sporosarcina sp. Te-1]QTD40614.1 hypothetical protein J3U78_17900 [Sporosarcina sp. Te-1]